MGTLTAVIHRRAINLRAYMSIPYRAARILNQLRRGHRAWPMFELKSGAAMAAPAAPMPPPLRCKVWPKIPHIIHGENSLTR